MIIAIINIPQYKEYWFLEFLYERTATALTLERYETLRKFLHVTDNAIK